MRIERSKRGVRAENQVRFEGWGLGRGWRDRQTRWSSTGGGHKLRLLRSGSDLERIDGFQPGSILESPVKLLEYCFLGPIPD